MALYCMKEDQTPSLSLWFNAYLSPPRSRDRFLARFSRSRSLSRRRRAGEGERPIVCLNFIRVAKSIFFAKISFYR